MDEDAVFHALADRSRRAVLDRLRARDGRTLGDLHEGLGMTRQAVSKHLAVLEDANLIATLRRGREKLHFLNPVPIHAIATRWIQQFERPALDALADLKRDLEGEGG
jgi:DNA-binding transcriptional ArsR family regulator